MAFDHKAADEEVCSLDGARVQSALDMTSATEEEGFSVEMMTIDTLLLDVNLF